MRTLLLGTFMIVFACSICANAGDFKKPTRTPSELTLEQKTLLKEGIQLHDQADYDGAIRKYEEILKLNPDSVSAIYEMSFSYFAKKDFKKVLELSEQGVDYISEALPQFYLQMASCWDYLGEPDKAIGIYKDLLEEYPAEPLLNYNIALTYFQQGKKIPAVPYLKRELFLRPGHPTSNLILGLIFRDNGSTIPAILAFSRFMILEPQTERAAGALQYLQQLINSGVKAEDEKNIKITLNPNSNKDEGDFDAIQTALALVSASRFLEENKNKSAIEKEMEQFKSFFQIMLEMIGDDKSKLQFTGEYYIPYFIDLRKNDHVEAFAYWIHSGGREQEVIEWLNSNGEKVQSFIDWNNQYVWPEPKE